MKKIIPFTLISWALLIGAPPLAHACFGPVPGSLTIAKGSTGTFSEACSATCVGTVAATSSNPSVASVSPASQTINATPKIKTVTGIAAGSATININWRCTVAGFGLKTGTFTVGVTVQPPTSTGTSGGNFVESAVCGEPINLFTGELFKQYPPDIELGGPMPLTFSRYYASGLKADNISGSMGNNWLHNFEWSLQRNASIVSIVSAQGRSIRFNKNGAQWLLSGRKDIPFQLVENTVTGNFTLADPRNNQTRVFNTAGQMIAIHDSVGNTHMLTYNLGGQLTQVSDGLGRTLNLIYNTGGRLSSINDGLGRNVFFSYVANDLTGVKDLFGNITTYAYAAGGLMTGATLPNGNIHHTQAYNTSNKVTSQTDAFGNINTLTYGTNTGWTDPLLKTFTSTHTTTGELNNAVRKDGSSITIRSNAVGQRNGVTDSLGATTSITYHTPSGRVATITRANGTTTSNAFAARTLTSGANLYDRTAITHADGTADVFVYNASGNLTSRNDRAGNTTNFTRNANGQWLTRINALGGVVTRSFNADGTQATNTDVSGNTTSFAYDGFRRPITTTFADTSTQAFTYDLLNRPLTITDNRGRVSRMAYDGNSNLISRTDRTGIVTTFTYDAADKVTKFTDANGAFSSRSYDILGRLSNTTDRNGNTFSLGYDTQNRLIALTDGNGNISRRMFDSEGIFATTTTPLGNVTRFTSDNMGNIIRVVSPLGNTLQLTYDNMSRVTQSTDPFGNISSTTYDALGLVASRTLPGTISASYTRNALGQITQIIDPVGNNWQRTIDTAGRVTASTDPLARINTFAYDNRNRIRTVTFPGGLGTLTNTYDANGNLTRKLYSDGTDLAFTYDAEDRLLTANGLSLARDNLGRITNSNGIIVAYDAGGRITSITYAAGKAVAYTYDGNNNVKTITDWMGGVSIFTYDADNRLSSMTRPNNVTTTYTYDNDGRLTRFTDGILGNSTLTRDIKGQITTANRTVPTAASATGMTAINHIFDAANQLSTAGFAYDALGRLTNNGVSTFVWDLASRLSSSGVTAYTYDGIGYRLSKTTAAGTRNYVWNLALSLPSVSIEKQGAADLRYYVHTPGGALLYSINAVGNTHHFYHFDEMGNTRFISNDAGTVEASYAYSPFGVLQATTGVLDNPFTWQGQGGLFDDGNGLYYVRARYYDANSARFFSPDPVNRIQRVKLNTVDTVAKLTFKRLNFYFASNPTLLNDYQYAVDNPLKYKDDSGSIPIINWFSKIGGFIKDGAAMRLDDINAEIAARNKRLLDRIDQGEDPTSPGFLKKEIDQSVGPGQAAIDIALGRILVNKTVVDRTLRETETLRGCNPLTDDLPGDAAAAVVAASSPNKPWGERLYDAFWAGVSN